MNADSITRGRQGRPLARASAQQGGKQDRQLAAIVDTAAKLSREQRPRGPRRRPRARQPKSKDPGILGAPGSRVVVDPPSKTTVIEGDDFITNINLDGSQGGTFVIATNPGIPTSFPMASAEAAIYEKYVVENMEYYLVPAVTEYGASEGQVILMYDYDAADAAPESVTEVLNNIPRAEGMPYHMLRLPLSPKKLNGGMTEGKYIRTSLLLPTGTDIKTYDAGNLYVFLYGVDGPNLPADALIGKLHVKYRLRLLNRQLPTLRGVTDRPTRNYVYTQCTSRMDNAGIQFDDTGPDPVSDWRDWPSNPNIMKLWEPAAEAIPLTASEAGPYQPLPKAYGGLGPVFANFPAIELPEGRFLLIAQLTLNANGHDSVDGNIDYCRVRLRQRFEADNDSYPAWGKEMFLTHHEESAGFSMRGGSVDLMVALAGPYTAQLQYQLGTDANVGAEGYYTIQVIAL